MLHYKERPTLTAIRTNITSSQCKVTALSYGITTKTQNAGKNDAFARSTALKKKKKYVKKQNIEINVIIKGFHKQTKQNVCQRIRLILIADTAK